MDNTLIIKSENIIMPLEQSTYTKIVQSIDMFNFVATIELLNKLNGSELNTILNKIISDDYIYDKNRVGNIINHIGDPHLIEVVMVAKNEFKNKLCRGSLMSCSFQ